MKYLFVVLLLPLLFSSCNDLEDGPQLVTGSATEDVGIGQVNDGLFNGNMEEENPVFPDFPNGWRSRVAFFNAPNNFNFEQSEESVEGRFSMSIEAESPIDDVEEYPYVEQIILNPQIPGGTFVRLTAQVKTENLSGNGFEILLLVADNVSNQFIPLAGTFPASRVSGNQDWREYEAELSGFPNGVGQLYVWVRLLPETTGKIYVDDMRLTYEFRGG